MEKQSPASLVSAAEIARIAGVTRAAVSNWRRRYEDFPPPAGGSVSAPLFALSDVEAWLRSRRLGKSGVSDEVRLWQALRGSYNSDVLTGITDVAQLLSDGDMASGAKNSRLTDEIVSLARETVGRQTTADIVDGLTARFVASVGRTESERITTPRIARAVAHFAAPITGTVFDPACGVGTLLLDCGDRKVATRCRGQDIDAEAARLARIRAQLAGLPDAEIRTGDSLRDDQWPDLRADIVVCNPPVAVADWGRAELMIDPRWEFGVPPRAESELAWLQHAYAHTAPGGRVVLVMPASAAYRKAGRRIRAELVRRGLVTDVVALPSGTAAAHAQPVHLWLLRRPARPGETAETVRMIDLTGQDPDDALDPSEEQQTTVPLIDLLDDTVDLSPGRYITPEAVDVPAAYDTVQAKLRQIVGQLLDQLPELGPGAGALDSGAQVSVTELVRARLVDLGGRTPVSTSDQLDTDYLNGFLHSQVNVRRATSGTGTYRTDARGARIPQMTLDEQRRYGAAFRAVTEFERRAKELARLSDQAAALARDGLTSGTLMPPPSPPSL